uniref:BPI1 domain-containing protein n=1 Tax=Macrostomum lignano TaxID=282301 RepID=A0A1I8J7C9_9PLAT
METVGFQLDDNPKKENAIEGDTKLKSIPKEMSRKKKLRKSSSSSSTTEQQNQQNQSIEQQLRNFNSILSLIPTNKIRGMVNDLADDLLKSVGPKLKLANLDPLKLPERSVEFEKQVCCKTYPGVAELKNGVCKGLSTARRHGEVGLDMQEGKAEITFSIRIGPVVVSYDSDVTLRNHVYHPTFNATTEYIDGIVSLIFNIKEGKMDMQKLK